MRFLIHGKIYENVHEVMRAFGVAYNTVYSAAVRGNLETLGTGRARPGNGYFRREEPFKIGKYTWPSMKQAARETGIPYYRFLRAYKPSNVKRYSTESTLKNRYTLLADIEKVMRRKEDERQQEELLNHTGGRNG